MALAPMDGVTDPPFRHLIASCCKPDVTFTEFVSVDGLCSAGRPRLMPVLRYTEIERPIVAQLFGDTPENFLTCARLMNELGFDGIDINMGCPVKVICKTGSGSSLIAEPALAQEVIQATIEGAGDLPVSVKTRIGLSTIVIEDWARTLLEAGPAAITFHLRTKKEMSKVPAHWEVMHLAVEAARGTGTLILGNGDVKSLAQADRLVAETGVDGIMFGRAIYGNPWLFSRARRYEDISLAEKFDTMLRHAYLFEEMCAGERPFKVMRKHLREYAGGFSGAKGLRIALEEIDCADDVVRMVAPYREQYQTEVSEPGSE